MAKHDTAENVANESPASEESKAASILTKMTLKGMGCRPQRAAAEEKRVPLARIYGYASGIKAKEDASGNIHQAIVGQFEGINLETGEVYRSGILFLPAGIHDLLAKPASEQGANVQFGLEIHSIPATNAIGYSYMAKSLLPVTGKDLLTDLRSTLALGHDKK